jgi:hypothetical protein
VQRAEQLFRERAICSRGRSFRRAGDQSCESAFLFAVVDGIPRRTVQEQFFTHAARAKFDDTVTTDEESTPQNAIQILVPKHARYNRGHCVARHTAKRLPEKSADDGMVAFMQRDPHVIGCGPPRRITTRLHDGCFYRARSRRFFNMFGGCPLLIVHKAALSLYSS